MSSSRIAAANGWTCPCPRMGAGAGCVAMYAVATCLQVGSELELPLDAEGFAVRCTVSLSSCNCVPSEARGLGCCQG